jgi:hypothetical protein
MGFKDGVFMSAEYHVVFAFSRGAPEEYVLVVGTRSEDVAGGIETDGENLIRMACEKHIGCHQC